MLKRDALKSSLYRHWTPLVVVLALAGYVAIYAGDLVDGPIRADGFEYYVYLPATIIHHDPTLERYSRDCCAGQFSGPIGISRVPSTGRWLNRHSMGVAVMVLPFFIVAHLLTLWANLPPDGLSLFYVHGSSMAVLFYLGAGMSLLKRVLAQYFSIGIVLATLVSITWGTNLFHYATFEPLFSHVYAFFLVCCLLHLTPRWYETPTGRDSIWIGLVAGLIVLVRPPNALFLLFFLLYDVGSVDAIKQRCGRLVAAWRYVLVIAAITVAIQIPQLALYHFATGRWFSNPYGEQGFHFASPRILEVLFSVQKGLLFWSPILLVSIVGLFVMRRAIRPWAIPTFVFLPLSLYVIASWDDWQYGGSFGHRAFTDAMPVFALAMAAGYERLTRSRAGNRVLAIFVAVAIALSTIQMIQFWLGVIPIHDTTWAQYKAVFLRFTR